MKLFNFFGNAFVMTICGLALLPRPVRAQEKPLAAASTRGDLRRGDKAPLAVRLGFKATDKILIINNDDAGMSHATNLAVMQGQEKGLTTSSTIMVPCPWFPEIAAYAKSHPDTDFGVHLTHTSEWGNYKWRPVASADKVPGLVDAQGYLWPDVASVYKNATPQQAEIEARAQIHNALIAGVDITHLDSHMGTMHFDAAYNEVYRKLAREFDLPVRMGSQDMLASLGAGEQRAQLDADGITYPDYLLHGTLAPGQTLHDWWIVQIKALQPGVTEAYMHAALPSEEMKGISPEVERDRAMEYQLFVNGPEMRQMLAKMGVKTLGWRALRDLQRRERREAAAATVVQPTQ